MAESADTIVLADADIDHAKQFARHVGIDDWLSPADLILQAHRRCGLSFIQHLEGDFAIALHDRSADRLFLIRDATGRRPLFYATGAAWVAFGARALPLAALDGRPKPDLVRLAAFQLRLFENGPRSFFEGVHRVMPGHYAEARRNGSIEQRRWWNPSVQPIPRDELTLLAELQAELDRAIEPLFATPGPLAAHLSAGLDSSITVATASRLTPGGKRIVAITGVAGHSGPADTNEAVFDESELASRTAAMLGNIDHRRVVAETASPLANFEAILPLYQRPLRNTVSIGWMEATVAEAEREGASVLVESDLGNQTVSWFAWGHLGFLLRSGRLGDAFRLLGRHRRQSGGTGLGMLARAIWQLAPPRLADGLARLAGKPSAAQVKFLKPKHSAVAAAVAEARSEGHRLRAAGIVPTGATGRLSMLSLFDDAPYRDSVRARYGIACRDPFASRRLIELCLTIDEAAFVADGRPRRVARALLEGKVPDSIASHSRIGIQAGDWQEAIAMAIPDLIAEIDLAEADDDLASFIDWPRARQCLATFRPSPGVNWPSGAADVLAALSTVIIARFVRWVGDADRKDE